MGSPARRPQPQPTSLANASPSVPPTPTSSPDLLGSDQAPVLAFYDAATGKLKGTTSVAPPRNISAFAGGSFWILTEDRGVMQFQRVDPLTNTIAQPITVPGVEPHGFAFDDDYIWITDLGSPQVYRIDQRTGAWTTINFGDESDMTPAGDVSVGDGSVWLSRDQHRTARDHPHRPRYRQNPGTNTGRSVRLDVRRRCAVVLARRFYRADRPDYERALV